MGKVKNAAPWCELCDTPGPLRLWHDEPLEYICEECYSGGDVEYAGGLVAAPDWDDLPPLDMEGTWNG